MPPQSLRDSSPRGGALRNEPSLTTPSDSASRIIDIADHDDVHEFMFDQGVTDGLPVVPPTRERVDRMLEHAPEYWSDSRAVVATLPPNMAPMTGREGRHQRGHGRLQARVLSHGPGFG